MGFISFSKFKFFHWYYYQCKKHHYFNFIIGVLTWAYIGVSLPFDYGIDNTSNFFFVLFIIIFILLPFGLAWPIISYIVDYFAKRIFSHKILEDINIAYKVLLIKILVFVHGAFILQGFICFWECVNLREYLEIWIKTLMLITPIYIFFTLYARRKFFHHSDKEDHLDDRFELTGSGKKSIKLKLENLVYIKSDDNYVDMIHIDDDGETKTAILRTTLESIANQLSANNEFVRVHRSYIVNLRFVNNLDKKDKLNLSFKDVVLEISVSKKYQEDLKKLLSL